MKNEIINKQGVERGLSVFHKEYPNYVFYNNFLTRQFAKLTKQLDKEHVIILLACIDSFGHTHCSDIVEYANVICDKNTNFWKRVNSGDITLINEIINKAKSKNRKVKKNISLLSKFCCKCNEENFPISDSQVRSFLIKYNKHLCFFKTKINKQKLHYEYEYFVEVMDSFITNRKLNKFKYRKLDLAIWTRTSKNKKS